MAADGLAPYVARTSAAMMLACRICRFWSNLMKDLTTCGISMWSNDIKCKYILSSLCKIEHVKGQTSFRPRQSCQGQSQRRHGRNGQCKIAIDLMVLHNIPPNMRYMDEPKELTT